MRNIELIRKFRPIFVFSKGEKHYPVNKNFLKGKQGNIKIEDTQNVNSRCLCSYFPVLYERFLQSFW